MGLAQELRRQLKMHLDTPEEFVISIGSDEFTFYRRGWDKMYGIRKNADLPLHLSLDIDEVVYAFLLYSGVGKWRP
jgi:hypothetical protein